MSYKSPLKWVGGKFHLAEKIISLFPDHKLYVEVFGGAGHVLFKKEPSAAEIYNDINRNLVCFFSTVRDKEKCVRLYERLDATPCSKAIFDDCINNLSLEVVSDLERAYCFIVVNAQCFGAIMETWGVTISDSKTVNSFHNVKERLLPASERLKKVQLECRDFRYIIKRYDRPDTLFYLDPPYAWDSRSSRELYEYELADKDHIDLVDLLLNLKGKAILSGYDTPLYDRLVKAGWRKISLGDAIITVSKVRDGKPRIRKEEFVWVKFLISK